MSVQLGRALAEESYSAKVVRHNSGGLTSRSIYGAKLEILHVFRLFSKVVRQNAIIHDHRS